MFEAVDGKALDRVVVVPARTALDEYLKYAAYICQPDRYFQPSIRMAFYTNNKIDRHIPKILGSIDAISTDEIETRPHLTDNERAMLRTLFAKMDYARKEEWSRNKLMIVFLTSSDSPDTLILPYDIENDQSSMNRQRIAFTQNQRYVTLSSLKKARYTSELENTSASSNDE